MTRSLSVVFVAVLSLLASRAGAAAPVVEDLGPVAFDARVQLGPLSPNPDGTGFVQLLFAFEGEWGTNAERPFDILAVDLASRAIKRVAVSGERESEGFEVWHARYPVWSSGPRPRLYFAPNGNGPRLVSWDPVTQKTWHSGRLFTAWPDTRQVYSLAIGSDGSVLGGGGNDNPIVRIDPRTGKRVESPPLSHPGDYHPSYVEEIVGTRSAIYALSGRIPYRLVRRPYDGGPDVTLFEFETDALFDAARPAESSVLLRIGEQVYLHTTMKGGATYRIRSRGGLDMRAVRGPAGAKTDLWWRVADDELTVVPSRPPRIPADRSPLPANPPEVVLDWFSHVHEGFVRLWYSFPTARPRGRMARVQPWQSVDVPVQATPMRTSEAVADPRGGVFGSSWHNGPFYRFDPKSGRAELVGPPVMVEVNGLLALNGKIYIGGYSAARVFEYDPSKPWTASTPSPFALPFDLRPDDPRQNPREIANFKSEFGALGSNWLVNDARGRIYVGTWSARNREGGGLGILTPSASGWSVDAIVDPLRNYGTTGLATTTDGRFVVLSTRVVKDRGDAAAPSEARVFVLDTERPHAVFSNSFPPVAGVPVLAPVAGVSETRIVGAAPGPESKSRFYLADIVSGETLRSVEYDGKLSISGSFVRAADGFVYATVENGTGRRIIRIAPDLSSVEAIVDVDGGYERLCFVGRDLYLTGTDFKTEGVTSLKRIRNFLDAAPPAESR